MTVTNMHKNLERADNPSKSTSAPSAAPKKIVIIGGVAGGATAAARLRRLDEHAQIIMIERTGYVSYANCGLPYYIGGVIEEKSKLTLQTPQSFADRFAVEARVHQEVVAIDRAAKCVHVRRLDDDTEYDETYDYLILSPGARAVMPPLPGLAELDSAGRLFTLRTVEDTFALAEYIEAKTPHRATVVGTGFIGLEVAENLAQRGIEVSLVEREDHAIPTLDTDLAALVHAEIRRHGIDLRLRANVEGFSVSAQGAITQLQGGAEIASDFVVMAVGVQPDSALAQDAGLELGMRGSIRVDAHMRTSDPSIYAVGDAVEVAHVVTGEPALIALAGPANKQGRIAADNICGLDSQFQGSQGSSVLKVFDLTVASTGLSEAQAARQGLEVDAVILSPASHATYYPGAGNLTLKVIFSCAAAERGRIVGAEIVGTDGVDKRLDVLAVAIRSGMDADALAELELAYAPPYSSAKDPVNMAGFMIQNLLGGLVAQRRWSEVEQRDAARELLLDVRTLGEMKHAPSGAELAIPVDELRERLSELPYDKRLLVCCASGLRSYVACRMLSQHGFECANVAGGYGLQQASLMDRALAGKAAADCGL